MESSPERESEETLDLGLVSHSSWTSHVQHLLRHLDNPTELHNNPLMLGETADSVRSRIRGIYEAMYREAALHPRDSSLRRQAEILRRCDLERHSHAAVASALGISRRQFYRERSAIAQWIAEHFRYDTVVRGNPSLATSQGGQSARVIEYLLKQTRKSEELHTEGRFRAARLIDRRLLSILSALLRQTGPDAVAVTQIALRLMLRSARRRELSATAAHLAMDLRNALKDGQDPWRDLLAELDNSHIESTGERL